MTPQKYSEFKFNELVKNYGNIEKVLGEGEILGINHFPIEIDE